MNLPADLKATLRHNVKLSGHCTMQVGGPARYFAEPSSEDELLELLEFAKTENIPFIILGKGSNVIFPDEGFPGLVITLIHFEQEKILFDSEKMRVTVSAGVFLYRLALACRDAGFGGIEFLANIPGTVGGALVMNAGFSRFPGQKNAIGDLVEEVVVLDRDGQRRTLTQSDLNFSYRSSNLNDKIILAAVFRLWKRRPEDIQSEIRANFDCRNKKQDLRYPSAGSVFKNPSPPHPAAARLIDQLGLKGTRVGGAMISDKHSNYFVNVGGAKSSDILQLIRQVQETVLNATGVSLEPEVRIIERP